MDNQNHSTVLGLALVRFSERRDWNRIPQHNRVNICSGQEIHPNVILQVLCCKVLTCFYKIHEIRII